MNLIFSIIIAGVLIYMLLKFCLYVYRPFFLSKTLRKIDEMYNRVMATNERRVGSAEEDLKKWNSGDTVLRDFRSKDEIIENINAANSAKAHEEEMYRKFLRLRERFIQKPTKLSEAIVAYQRYLDVRLNQIRDASLFASGVTSGAISFDEMIAAKNETLIILEENERKLDMLSTE